MSTEDLTNQYMNKSDGNHKVLVVFWMKSCHNQQDCTKMFSFTLVFLLLVKVFHSNRLKVIDNPQLSQHVSLLFTSLNLGLVMFVCRQLDIDCECMWRFVCVHVQVRKPANERRWRVGYLKERTPHLGEPGLWPISPKDCRASLRDLTMPGFSFLIDLIDSTHKTLKRHMNKHEVLYLWICSLYLMCRHSAVLIRLWH